MPRQDICENLLTPPFWNLSGHAKKTADAAYAGRARIKRFPKLLRATKTLLLTCVGGTSQPRSYARALFCILAIWKDRPMLIYKRQPHVYLDILLLWVFSHT